MNLSRSWIWGALALAFLSLNPLALADELVGDMKPPKPPGPGYCDGKEPDPTPVRLVVTVTGQASACVAFDVTARLYDVCGRLAEGFSGPAQIRDTAGALAVSQSATFEKGVALLRGVVIPRAVGSDRIVVEAANLRATSAELDVRGTGPAAGIELVAVPTGSQGACSQFNLHAIVRDQCGNRVTGYQSDARWSDTSGGLHLDSAAPFVNGQARATARIDHPYTADRISVSAVGGLSVESAPFDVVGHAALERLRFDPLPAQIKRCTLHTITAYAEDACGNRVDDFDAPATWVDLSGKLRPKSPCEFKRGVMRALAVFKKKYEGDRITLQAGGKQGVSNSFDVVKKFKWLPWSADPTLFVP